MKLYGSQNKLTNVLESCDNQGIWPNNEGTNTLYESQWYDNVVEEEHVRQPTEKALRTPYKWSKELINEVDETKIQWPLGLSSVIDVLMSQRETYN